MNHFNEVNRHTVGAVTCSCSLNPKRCFFLGQVISRKILVHTFLISQALIQSNTSRCTIVVWPNAAVLGFLRLSSTWYDFTPWCDLPLALVGICLKSSIFTASTYHFEIGALLLQWLFPFQGGCAADQGLWPRLHQKTTLRRPCCGETASWLQPLRRGNFQAVNHGVPKKFHLEMMGQQI